MAFSPTSTHIASASDDGTVRVWAPLSAHPQPQSVATLRHFFSVHGVHFSPHNNGAQLVCGVSNGTLRVWEWAEGREVLQLKGHSNTVRSCRFSKNGQEVCAHTLRVQSVL